MPYLHTNYPNTCRGITLSTPESLVLTAARLWVAGYLEPLAAGDWRQGLRAAALDAEAVSDFNEFLAILVRSTWEVIEVHSPRCHCIGNDEGLLLELIGLLQHKQFDAAREILEYWTPPAAVRMALPPALHFADALLGGGLVLPLREAGKANTNHAVLQAGKPQYRTIN